MNFLNKRKSAVAVACHLVLFQLLGCYSSPVRSPRTSAALKLRNIVLANIQRVARSDQDYHLIPNDENGADVAVTPGRSLIPSTAEGVPLDEPEAIDNTGPIRNDPDLPDGSDETEHPALPTDVDSGLHNSDSVETVTSSNVQEPIQKLEDPSYSKILPEKELLTPSELYHSATAEAPSNPAELPLTYPIVRVPEGPSAIPITVADLPLELPSITAGLPEKEEISSSLPEAPEQGNNVGALPLELDAKTQTASSSFSVDPQQIQVDPSKYQPNNSYGLITIRDDPNEKDNNSSGRPIGSRLRELGFPPISNTQDNFGVQINWAEFR